ncbi:MAG: L,D-transpeptidase [Desulfobaccales bacterium]
MKRYLLLLGFPILLHLAVSPAAAANVFQRYEKVIWINQHKQVGAAYENGKKLFEFPVITGDDETTTNPGIYPVKLKDADYYSKKYDTAMPYSLFFDLKEMKAIHGGEVPPPAERVNWATHGCVHVEDPYIERLFDWAEVGKTVVVIQGWRDED